MSTSRIATSLALAAAVLATGFTAAAPASAGGIGDFLSPAFGTSCANHKTHTAPQGRAHTDSGGITGLLAQVPATSPVNQCGGADASYMQINQNSGSYARAPLFGI